MPLSNLIKRISFSLKEGIFGCRDCRENLEELMLKLIAHEIRNPVTQIGGLVNRLHAKYTNGEGERFISEKDITKLNAIKKEADRICGITFIFDELIRNPVFRPKQADIDSIISNIIKIELHDLARFHWHSNHQKQPLVDSARLSFALLNIVRNAKDAIIEKNTECKKEEVIYHGEIVITTSSDADTFCVEIRNNGVAIPKEALSEIFRPYFSTKGEGKGFGLTIARDIIEKHSGTIHVKSGPDETSFRMIFPLKQAEKNQQRNFADSIPAFT